jgi:hypothetical protein
MKSAPWCSQGGLLQRSTRAVPTLASDIAFPHVEKYVAITVAINRLIALATAFCAVSCHRWLPGRTLMPETLLNISWGKCLIAFGRVDSVCGLDG